MLSIYQAVLKFCLTNLDLRCIFRKFIFFVNQRELNMNYTKTDFLYKAIEDTRDTIRFIDTKSAGLVVVVALVVGIDINFFEKFLDLFSTFSILFKSVIFTYFISIFISFIVILFLAIKTIQSQTNPEEHITLNNYESKKIFYLSDLHLQKGDYFFNRKGLKLFCSFNEIKTRLDSLKTSEDILNELIVIHLKLSFIKELKVRRLNLAFRLFYFFLIFSIVLILIYLRLSINNFILKEVI